MTLEDLENRYSQIPQEIKNLRRWICYNIEKDKDTGEEKKTPRNAISGGYAKSNDPLTWTTFRVALAGCIKYGFVGLGFMLGEDKTAGTTYFGIDLDNHADKVTGEKPLDADDFGAFCREFIDALDSYTEYSHSGEGVHIICKGKLPEGARRRNGVAVEMYDKGRFFTMTGKVIRNVTINERSEQIKPLWEKYLNVYQEQYEENPHRIGIIIHEDNSVTFGGSDYVESNTVEFSRTLDDDELIAKIRASNSANDFLDLYSGNMRAYSDDHSAADLAFCKILAFWTGCDKTQMDRIFRRSGLMRKKWDEKRQDTTYGDMTINKAIRSQRDVYNPPKERITVSTLAKQEKQFTVNLPPVETDIIEMDDKGDPKITIKQIFKHYALTDTGNAERFYDYFNDRFRYNTDDNLFMFWDGRTWLRDSKSFVKKYADKLIDVLKNEIKETEQKIKDAMKGDEINQDEVNGYKDLLKAQEKNATRVANSAGKTSMLTELEHMHKMPVVNKEFDTQPYYLNTLSGVVDLLTGNILSFDKKYMLSKNTNCAVDFGEPTTFIKFLHDICDRPNKQEVEEIIGFMQMVFGEALSGQENKEHITFLWGNGSNGKSTFIKTILNVMGDYGKQINSALLMQNPNSSSQSTEFSLSSLLGARGVFMSETPQGKQLDENLLKQMTSGERISAQRKFGNQFEFNPTFSLFMSTNNKPVIRATDYGTWRRIFLIPFLNKFTDANKDIHMPEKLKAEAPKILGWLIKGCVKLYSEHKGIIPKPKCVEEALADYRNEMDVIAAFVSDRCVDFPNYKTSAVELYREYKDWAKTNNEYLMSETKFKLELPKRGYVAEKDPNVGRVYVGLKLATDKRGVSFAGFGGRDDD